MTKKRSRSLVLDVAGSKCLADARWSSANGGTLAVQFVKGGAQYLYFGVERSIAREINSGEAFNELIKDNYDYE